jgi:hypothetical protein
MLSKVAAIFFVLHAVLSANIKIHLPSNPAHVKNYTAKKKCNMAIYCLTSRISIKGGKYLLELQDKNREYRPMAAIRNKDAVFGLIFEMLSDTFSVDIAVKNLRSEELIIGKNIHGGLKTLHRSEILTETIDRYLKVLENETPISNIYFSYVCIIITLLLSSFFCICIHYSAFSFWKGSGIVPHAWSL